jgi:hypothetical protein
MIGCLRMQARIYISEICVGRGWTGVRPS